MTFRRNVLPPFSGINTLIRDPEDGVITLLTAVSVDYKLWRLSNSYRSASIFRVKLSIPYGDQKVLHFHQRHCNKIQSGLMNICWRFGGAFCLQLQGWTVFLDCSTLTVDLLRSCPASFALLSSDLSRTMKNWQWLRQLDRRNLNLFSEIQVDRDNSVGIATGYGLDVPRIESRSGARFSAPVQTGPGTHTASCTMVTGSLSRG